MNDKTIQIPRMPQRPANGLLAWQATVGYIHSEYSTDAALMLRAIPREGVVTWQATISWSEITAQVADAESLGAALRELWLALKPLHPVFTTEVERVRQPAGYLDHQWLDSDTARTVDNLIDVTRAVFHDDWALVLVYQALETPAERVKARLIAKDHKVQISGQGPSLREACRDLYRHAAPGYFASSGRDVDWLV